MSRRRQLEAQYDRLLEEHGAALRRVAGSYEADPSLRDDLFQDICLALWRALPSFRGESSERTFAFRIAHNRGLTHGWRHQRRSRVEGVPLEGGTVEEAPTSRHLTDSRRDPEAEAVAGDRQRRLRSAVLQLPVPARQVLTLALEGLPQRDIAEILGLREGTVSVRLHRARKTLRTLLQAQEGRGRR